MARSFHQPVEVIVDSPFVMVGSADALANHVQRLRDEHGVTYITLFERFADDFARVMPRLR